MIARDGSIRCDRCHDNAGPVLGMTTVVILEEAGWRLSDGSAYCAVCAAWVEMVAGVA